ncbi:hypothetical protein DAI43_30475 [Achromobacter xylosoxidans]|nr:hypothetical protein DAI43_30475 [Achromobacter xylosoxidans]
MAAARRLPGAVHAALRLRLRLAWRHADAVRYAVCRHFRHHAVRRRRAPRAARGLAEHQARVTPKEAQAILQQVADTRTLREVSLNAQGRVEEYELGINYTFRLIDAKGRALIPDTTLSIYREMPYDDQVVQAKQGQIETLYRAMQRDLVSRLLRRMTAPEVRHAFENAEERAEDGETPLYDPTTPEQKRTPAPWQTPSTTDPAILR